MKYQYKVFLWENGHKSTEYTNNLIAPIFIEDRLNEELDTGEIVLDRMPLSTKNLFPPKTKFRIERYLISDPNQLNKKWDMIVDHDDVESYLGSDDLCCHRISLIEASAITQGMHIDNIALTYELQDVSLNYKTYKEDFTKLNDLVEVEDSPVQAPIKQPNDASSDFEYSDGGRYNYFRNAYSFVWSNVDSIKGLTLNLSVNEVHTISFEIPTLKCQGCPNSSSYQDLFEMNTITRVWRTETSYNSPVGNTRTLILEKKFGPASFQDVDNSAVFISGGQAFLRELSYWNETMYSRQKDNFQSHFTIGSCIAECSPSFSDKTVVFQTIALSDAEIEQGKGYYYEIECIADPVVQNAIFNYYSVSCFAESEYFLPQIGIGIGYWAYRSNRTSSEKNILQPSEISVKASFNVTDLSSEAVGGPMLKKGVKYSCYELLRKALLTTDTQLININEMGIDEIPYFLYVADSNWLNRLKTFKIQETILENKNLWEVLIQIGYYLHAIPFLEFSDDGTDRFVLGFKQLGDTKKKNNTSNKITIYNSRALSEYFTQYDSYITNIFSPQNIVDEWLVVKTNDGSALVSNNTAILKTSYGISEIIDFEIIYDGSVGGASGKSSALNHIFEKSIYDILTSEYNISPGKGDSLYYELGTNLIQGLTYTPPTSDGTVMPYALKRIAGKIFSGLNVSELKFNNLQFHIRYRTQDTLRISQVRPNLLDFIKNSSYEKYVHNEQWYGQQDKIIDSERFSRNLFGKLIRVGNDVYQVQEMVIDFNEKESGDLVEIDGEPYYVTVVENELYPDATFQKVTYSKNYNQLSQIVTIPSEPRFYEVSERSKIRREIRFFEFLNISTKKPSEILPAHFLNPNSWQSLIKAMIFNDQQINLPNYAWVRFQADKKRYPPTSINQMFPSVEIDRTNPNQVRPKDPSDHADCIVPLLHFPLQDGIVFECDMEDNFKAGDSIDTTISGKNDTVDEAYYALQAVRYCDIYGRADLLSFRMFFKEDWNHLQSQGLPKACIEPAENESFLYIPQPKYAALDKDCRCMISLNCQICLLYRNDDMQGDYVTYSNIFGEKTNRLHCCMMDREVSMFDENASIIDGTILADNLTYNLIENYTDNCIEISFVKPDNLQLSKVKSIIFYDVDEIGNRVSYLAKNFKNGISGESIPTFYIYPVFNDN